MPNNDPQTAWQRQNTEEMKVPLEYFKLKADQLRSRNRWIVAANDAVYAACLPFFAFLFIKTPSLASRIGLVLLAAGWFYTVYRQHGRLWPTLSAEPPVNGIEAYRRELLRGRDMQSHIWRALAPVLPGAIVFAASVLEPLARAAFRNPAVLIDIAPFSILLAVWLVLLIVVRKRWVKKIDQELDLLRP